MKMVSIITPSIKKSEIVYSNVGLDIIKVKGEPPMDPVVIAIVCRSFASCIYGMFGERLHSFRCGKYLFKLREESGNVIVKIEERLKWWDKQN